MKTAINFFFCLLPFGHFRIEGQKVGPSLLNKVQKKSKLSRYINNKNYGKDSKNLCCYLHIFLSIMGSSDKKIVFCGSFTLAIGCKIIRLDPNLFSFHSGRNRSILTLY